MWVEAEEAPQRGLPRPDSLPHLAEPFFCAFKQLASQGNGERSTMPQGGRLLTHDREEPLFSSHLCEIGRMGTKKDARDFGLDSRSRLGCTALVAHAPL